jgi:hypothetical protein
MRGTGSVGREGRVPRGAWTRGAGTAGRADARGGYRGAHGREGRVPRGAWTRGAGAAARTDARGKGEGRGLPSAGDAGHGGRPPRRGAGGTWGVRDAGRADPGKNKRTVGPLGVIAAQSGQRCDLAGPACGRHDTATGSCSSWGAEPGSACGSADSRTPVRGGSSAPPRTPRRCSPECVRAH